jgi:hypothetical protein
MNSDGFCGMLTALIPLSIRIIYRQIVFLSNNSVSQAQGYGAMLRKEAMGKNTSKK